MVVSLRTSKAKLSSLIARVEQGEEILITVRGKPRARLTAVASEKKSAMKGWATELQKLHQKVRGKSSLPAAKAVSDLRTDR